VNNDVCILLEARKSYKMQVYKQQLTLHG